MAVNSDKKHVLDLCSEFTALQEIFQTRSLKMNQHLMEASRDKSPEIRIVSVVSLAEKTGEQPKKKHCGAQTNKIASGKNTNEDSNERQFKCDYCSYVATTASSLRTHNKRPIGPTLKCSKCYFTSCTLNLLQRHMKKIHMGCSIPTTGSQPLGLLRNCIKTTEISKIGNDCKVDAPKNGTKRFHCDRCSYSTTIALSMKAHFTHWKCTPVLCCPICSFTACFQIALSKHIKLVHQTLKKSS